MTTESNDDPPPAFGGLMDKLREVSQRAQPRIDRVEVRHVVAIVSVGPGADRVEPQARDPEPGEVVEPAGEAGEVAAPIASGILERLEARQ